MHNEFQNSLPAQDAWLLSRLLSVLRDHNEICRAAAAGPKPKRLIVPLGVDVQTDQSFLQRTEGVTRFEGVLPQRPTPLKIDQAREKAVGEIDITPAEGGFRLIGSVMDRMVLSSCLRAAGDSIAIEDTKDGIVITGSLPQDFVRRFQEGLTALRRQFEIPGMPHMLHR